MRVGVRPGAAILTALLLAGCGSRSQLGDGAAVSEGASIAFPAGTYTSCADGVHGSDTAVFLNGGGFQSGASLTVAQHGTSLTAKYVDPNGNSNTLDLEATTSRSATLAPSGQVLTGFSGLCVKGPGNEHGFPATLNASAGAMTYDSGTVLVAVEGVLGSSAGCGNPSEPADFWIVCQGGSSLQPDVAPADPGPLLAGTYTCSSEVETHDHAGGLDQYVADGSDGGILTLMASGSGVTAVYTGDSSIAAKLQFVATTPTSAYATGTPSLTVPCLVPLSEGVPPPPTPEPVSNVAASLTAVGSTLFLSFAGTMGPGTSCPGAQKAGSLVCTKP